ncbi:hypothetical protein HY637_04045 [Candidatus Woesearchaeota archaeon]|nr:hypothetical protein [Candidatus Woesearchaeota archaeon]
MGWQSIKAERRTIYATIVHFLESEARDIEHGRDILDMDAKEKTELKGNLFQCANILGSISIRLRDGNEKKWRAGATKR